MTCDFAATSTNRISRLRQIVKNGLTSSFQSIYKVGDLKPFAVEGFIRGPIGTALEAPEKLFQAAQEADTRAALDEAAYTLVLQSFAKLHWPGKLFLNIRPNTLLASAFALTHLQLAIKNAGLHPSQIILEFTEHEPILSPDLLLRLIDPLLDQGATISLDDVGAAFASMRVICELQPHLIKVDRFFIDGIANSLVKRSVVQSFVNLASDIGAQVVAEGIEQGEDAQVSMQLGIGIMQGFLFGNPSAKPEFTPLPEGFWGSLRSARPRRPKCNAILST